MNDEPSESPSAISSAEGVHEQLDEQIARLEAQLRPLGLLKLPSFHLIFIMMSVGFAIFGRNLLSDAGLEQTIYSRYAPLIGIGAAVYGAMLLGFGLTLRTVRDRQLYQELEVLRARKRALTNPMDPSAPLSYFDRLVNINVSNLEAYYTLVKVHTNNSFLAAISTGGIGFLLIVTGLIIGFTEFTNSEVIAYISAGSGIITEFIASVFFYLYNRTTRQLKKYHDSLIDVQNVLLSFKIVGDTSDDATRAAMTKSMLGSLIKSKSAAST